MNPDTYPQHHTTLLVPWTRIVPPGSAAGAVRIFQQLFWEHGISDAPAHGVSAQVTWALGHFGSVLSYTFFTTGPIYLNDARCDAFTTLMLLELEGR